MKYLVIVMGLSLIMGLDSCTETNNETVNNEAPAQTNTEDNTDKKGTTVKIGKEGFELNKQKENSGTKVKISDDGINVEVD